jgi:hypothetical protein
MHDFHTLQIYMLPPHRASQGNRRRHVHITGRLLKREMCDVLKDIMIEYRLITQNNCVKSVDRNISHREYDPNLFHTFAPIPVLSVHRSSRDSVWIHLQHIAVHSRKAD